MSQLKYKEVEKEMRQLALTLPTGAKIPPERHLAVTYSCNFLTVRKALKSLVEDGTIIRRVGSGSFVAERPVLGQSRKPAFPVAKNNRIGLLVYHKSNAYAHKVLHAIAHSAMEQNIELRSSWVRDFEEEGLKQAHAFAQEGCGAIVLPWYPLDMTALISAFIQKSPLPVAGPMPIPGHEKSYHGKPELFGRSLVHATESLCRYFRLLGRTHVALLGPNTPNDDVLQKMLSAYTCNILQNHLPNLCGLALPGSNSMDSLADQWKKYAGSLAVISYDDEHALRFMTAMHKIGLNAPGDYSIIGHNDMEASRFSDPPLSTISQDFPKMSHDLLTNASAMARGSHYVDDAIPVSRLLIRGTCGGRGKITPALRKELPDLELIIEGKEENPSLHALPKDKVLT
jgi:DNA-binding LacI/PurR family transcriptional regulator